MLAAVWTTACDNLGPEAMLDARGVPAVQSSVANAPNQTPVAVGTMPDEEMSAGSGMAFGVASYFSDPDGDTLGYSAASSDAGVARASASGESLTLSAVGAGTATVTVTARDPGGLTAEQSFTVTVPDTSPNRAPVAVGTIPGQELSVGSGVGFGVASYFSDPDKDTLDYSTASSDAGVAEASTSERGPDGECRRGGHGNGDGDGARPGRPDGGAELHGDGGRRHIQQPAPGGGGDDA